VERLSRKEGGYDFIEDVLSSQKTQLKMNKMQFEDVLKSAEMAYEIVEAYLYETEVTPDMNEFTISRGTFAQGSWNPIFNGSTAI